MSVLFNAGTDKAVATLSLHSDDNYYWTFFDFWKRDSSSGTHGRVLCMTRADGAASWDVRCEADGKFVLYDPVGNFNVSTLAVTAGQWNGVALCFDVLGNTTFCLRRPGDSGFDVACTLASNGNVHQPAKPTLGSRDTGSYASALGNHAHPRVFTGGAARSNTAYLSLANLDAEYESATLVKTSLGTNGVYEAWDLFDDLAATFNTPTNDMVGTGTSIASPADDPTFGGGISIPALMHYYRTSDRV
jgi:hypothetical protein